LKGLFNVRGGDIPYNPVFLSYGIVSMDSVKFVSFQKEKKSISLFGFYLKRLFADLNKISDQLKKDLEDEHVTLYSYESFYEQLKQLIQSNDSSNKFCVNTFFFFDSFEF